MQKKPAPNKVDNKPAKVFYTIERVGSGYAVIDDKGNRVTPENNWPIAIGGLEKLLRKENGL